MSRRNNNPNQATLFNKQDDLPIDSEAVSEEKDFNASVRSFYQLVKQGRKQLEKKNSTKY